MKNTYRYTVKLPREAVISILSDLSTYCRYHPLILNTDPLDDHWISVHERPYSWLPFKITYMARSIAYDDGISFEFSKVLGLFQPRFSYKIIEMDNRLTELNLTITISGFPIGRMLLAREMNRAQIVLWKSAESAKS